MENNDIRLYAKGAGVPLWKIADKLGVSEATMTRMLRNELTEERRSLILKAIEDLKEAES